MKLICVGGLSSGCGKTSVVCMLLKAFPGWGAIKVTPSRPDEVCPRGQDCEACQPPDGPYDVTIDSEIPELPGTDTSRFRDAGASHVAFVRALPECLPIALESALQRCFGISNPETTIGLPGVIVESTTAMPLIDGLRILVARQGMTEVKDSALAAAGLADILAVNQDADGSSGCFGISSCTNITGLMNPKSRNINVCASLRPEHPCNRDFISECRLFTER